MKIYTTILKAPKMLRNEPQANSMSIGLLLEYVTNFVVKNILERYNSHLETADSVLEITDSNLKNASILYLFKS